MNFDTFSYGDVDMLETFGIKVLAIKTLSANLRPRKVKVPLRSGEFDYGANFHDERTIRIECTVTREMLDDEFDTLKYLLSKKRRLVLWDQEDRFYFGMVYNHDEVLEYFRHCGKEFELDFICEPYASAHEPSIAYGEENFVDMKKDENSYKGTRKVPTRITIRNTGETPITRVKITSFEER